MLAIAPVATRAVLVMLNPASSTNHPPILRHPPHPGTPGRGGVATNQNPDASDG